MKVSSYLERPLRTLAEVAAARGGQDQDREPSRAGGRRAQKRPMPGDSNAASSVRNAALSSH